MNHSKSKNPWIAGLSSFAIHLAILLIMAIWTIAGTGLGHRLSIEAGVSNGDAESIETVVIESQSNDEASQSGVFSDAIQSSFLASDVQPTLVTIPGELPQKSETVSDTIRLSGTQGKGNGAAFVRSSLEGRSPKNRAITGQRNGATPASEAAVEAALAYLARHQRNNGSWTVRFEEGPCNGECDHGGIEKDPHEIAATGLALLCFLGAGHTMHEGEYSDNVNRGVYFLVQNLKEQNGRGTWLTMVARSEMYEHGIATLALCEALQMKGDASIKESCQLAINQIIYAQHPAGGWDYHPKGKPGDLSIVGWQVMALKSAFSAKIVVNAETIRGIDLFLRKHSKSEFMFAYSPELNPTASMTAIGTLMRIFRGWSNTDPAILKAIDYLSKEGPSPMDLYYDYYATQVLFQYGGKPWKDWNEKMREYLIKTQEKEGHMAGSWWFAAAGGKPTIAVANKNGAITIANQTGGRLYVTAMACLTLEVYYRYLPVYDSVTDDFQF